MRPQRPCVPEPRYSSLGSSKMGQDSIGLGKCAGFLSPSPRAHCPAAVSPVPSNLLPQIVLGKGRVSSQPLPQVRPGKRLPTTAVLPLLSPPYSSRSAMKSQSQGGHVPGEQRLLPLQLLPCPGPRPGPGSPTCLLTWSKRKSSSLSPPGGRLSKLRSRSSNPSGKLLERKDLQESFLETIKPAHSVSGYNDMGVAGDKPGSVMSMKVVF